MNLTGKSLGIPSVEEVVFFSNVEAVHGIDGFVTGRIARVLAGLSARGLWYGYGTLILPREPAKEFQNYTRSFGRSSRIIVPNGINLEKMSILDGIKDPAVQEAILEGPTTSYVGSPTLFSAIEERGGQYIGGNPNAYIRKVNDKTLYSTFSKEAVDVPKGEIATGLHAIAVAVRKQLSSFRNKVFVRLSHAAGGQGNCLFELAEDQSVPSVDEIKMQLQTKDGQDWTKAALVEEYLDIVFSPAVTFSPGTGFLYDNLQITNEGSYQGSWSPVPKNICDNKKLTAIGSHFASELAKVGFQLPANTDLGVTANGRIVGFEINGRMTAASHAIAAGELLLGPWSSWRKKHIAIKSLDHFKLNKPQSFEELHNTLDRASLLATKTNPYGVVITIPPFETSHGIEAGLQFHGKGKDMAAYEMAQSFYKKTLELVGDPSLNIYDNPLFA